MPIDEVRAARARLMAAVNMAAVNEARAAPSGSEKVRAARIPVPSDSGGQVNELHVISYTDGSGGDITGHLSWQTAENLQEIAGVRFSGDRAAIPALSAHQIEALGQALIRAGTRVHRHERTHRPASGHATGLTGRRRFRLDIRVDDPPAALREESHPPD